MIYINASIQHPRSNKWAVWVLCLDWGMCMWWVRLFHPGAQFFSSLTNLINVYLFMYWKHSHSLEVFLFRWSDCISWKAWERFCPHPDGQMDGLSLILNLLLHKKYWKCDETLSPLMRHTLCTNTFNQYIKRNSGEQRKQAVYTTLTCLKLIWYGIYTNVIKKHWNAGNCPARKDRVHRPAGRWRGGL